MEVENITHTERNLLVMPGRVYRGQGGGGCDYLAARGESSVCEAERPRRDNLVKLTGNPF